MIEATSADEALLVLQQAKLTIDVVLSDTEMPGSMDGFSLARWIRENKPGLIVILVDSTPRAVAAAGKLCEFGPARSKPYDPRIVLDQIKRLAAERATGLKIINQQGGGR